MDAEILPWETENRPPPGGQAPTPEDLFAQCFAAHFESMIRLAFLLGADDPEDIAQEAFVRLHLRISRMNSPELAAAYARTTVVNLTRSRVRHLKVVMRNRQPGHAVPSAEALTVLNEEHRHLADVVARLPKRQREVIVLRYWLDLRESEIAETLGIANGTVKATASHALRRLAHELGDAP